MRREVRVALYGVGNMGSGIARILLEKSGFKIVGAICGTDEKDGKDLGEILDIGRSIGVRAWKDRRKVLGKKADVLIHARRDPEEVLEAIRAGMNVISIAGELACPVMSNTELGEKVDRLARKVGVTVFGTGVNPGFIFDTFIFTLTGVCHEIFEIRGFRSFDMTPFAGSLHMMEHMGIGLQEREFQEKIESGTIVTHSLAESVGMIADTLGWEISKVEESVRPVLAGVRKETPSLTIPVGHASGFSSSACGFGARGESKVTLEVQYHIMPQADGHEIVDHIEIKGVPPINLKTEPCIDSYYGTITSVVNSIPKVLNAKPGLVTMRDLPVRHVLMRDVREFLK